MSSIKARTERIQGNLDDLRSDGIIKYWLREHQCTGRAHGTKAGEWVITYISGGEARFTTREAEIFSEAALMAHIRHVCPGKVPVETFED